MTTRKVKLLFCGKAIGDNNEVQQQTVLWKKSHKRKVTTEADAAFSKTKQNKTKRSEE